MYNDPKHTVKATQEFVKAKKLNILNWLSQSPYLNPTEHTFHLLKIKLKAERTNNMTAAVKAWQSNTKKESIWRCPWVPDFKQSTKDNDSQLSIQNYNVIYDF